MASTILSKGLNKISLSGQTRKPTDDDYIKYLDYEDLERRFQVHKYYPVYIHNNGVSTPTLKSMLADKPIYSKANKHVKTPKVCKARENARVAKDNIRVKPPAASAARAETSAPPPYSGYEPGYMVDAPVSQPPTGRDARKAARKERHDMLKEHLREKSAQRQERRDSRLQRKIERREPRSNKRCNSLTGEAAAAYSDLEAAACKANAAFYLNGFHDGKNYIYTTQRDQIAAEEELAARRGEQKQDPRSLQPADSRNRASHHSKQHSDVSDSDDDALASTSFAPLPMATVFHNPFASSQTTLINHDSSSAGDKSLRSKRRNNSIASKFLSLITGNSNSPPSDDNSPSYVLDPHRDSLQLRTSRSFDQTKSTLTSSRKSQKNPLAKLKLNDSAQRRLSDQIRKYFSVTPVVPSHMKRTINYTIAFTGAIAEYL